MKPFWLEVIQNFAVIIVGCVGVLIAAALIFGPLFIGMINGSGLIFGLGLIWIFILLVIYITWSSREY